MKVSPGQFSYSQGGLPFLPVTLISKTCSVQVSALVDSGSTVSVLPYNIGVDPGFDWETQTFSLPVLGAKKGA